LNYPWIYKYNYPFNGKQSLIGKSFPNVLPIQTVLLNCYDHLKNRIFSKELSLNYSKNDENNQSLIFKIIDHGEFKILECNFSTGLFQVEFKSLPRFQGSIEIQIFIKAQDHPNNIDEKNETEKKINELEKKLKVREEESQTIRKEYLRERDYIDQKIRGVFDDTLKLEKIAERLISLNYDKSKFLDKIKITFSFTDKEKVQLGDLFNLLSETSTDMETYTRNNENLEFLGIYRLDPNLKELFDHMSDEYIKLFGKISKLTGLSFQSLKTICNGLVNKTVLENLTLNFVTDDLYQKRKDYEENRIKYASEFNKSKKEHLEKKEIKIIDTIKEIFSSDTETELFERFSEWKNKIENSCLVDFSTILTDSIDFKPVYNNKPIEEIDNRIKKYAESITNDYSFGQDLEGTNKGKKNMIVKLQNEKVIFKFLLSNFKFGICQHVGVPNVNDSFNFFY
jgi:hypothetical protein